MYIKILINGQQTKQVQQQLWNIDALVQPKVTVNVPAITQANILHNSDGYVRDAQWNS